MKCIYKSIYFLLGLFMLSSFARGQECSSITVEAISMNPQVGAHNYFGVRVTLAATHYQDITVTGYIHRDVDEENNQDHPFTLTVTPGNTVAETPISFFETDPTSGASVTIASISFCPANVIVVNYAGVDITYEVDNHILRFNSPEEFHTVVEALDEENENYNEEYEASLDDNMTDDEMEETDDARGFDEFYTFKVFENLFPGLTTKRMHLEELEATWLSSSFEAEDPDDFDLTYDDAENTIFNSDYSFKIGADVYQLTDLGLLVNGSLEASANGVNMYRNSTTVESLSMAGNALNAFELAGNSETYTSGPSIGSDIFDFTGGALFDGCKSNKKDKRFDVYGNTRFKIKVAINSVGLRSSAKGKVVHYNKKSNGNWKRKRTKMAVYCGGTVYNNECNESFAFDNRKPSPNGWKKRKSLKVKRWQPFSIWRTKTNQLYASYLTQSGYNSGIILTF